MQQVFKQITDIWKKLTRKQRIILGVAAASVLIALAALSFWAGQPDYVPVVTDLTVNDTAKITGVLGDNSIQYKISEDESQILVPSKDKQKARMLLATEGFLNEDDPGFELFDQTKLGTTDRERDINYQRALQGELEETINTLEGVKAARVHITVPAKEFFEKNQKPSKASVTLQLEDGKELEPQQVEGVVNLVVSAVEGLDPKDVVIIDTNGNIISQQNLNDDLSTSGQVTAKQLDVQNAFNKQLENSIQSMLNEVFGYDSVVVRANAELNFDKKEIEKDLYQPVTDDKGIVRQEDKLQESYTGTNNDGGVPGTTSNPPTYPYVTGNGDTSGDKYQVSTKYEINNLKVKQSVAAGAVKKLSIGVIVDSSKTNYSQQQLNAIQQVVSAAVGISQDRGDNIYVEAFPFNRADEVTAQSQTFMEKYRKQIIFAVQILGILLAFLILYLTLFRRKKKVQEESIDFVIEEPGLSMELDAAQLELASLSPEEIKRREMLEEISKLAAEQPESVAMLIRTWMAADEE